MEQPQASARCEQLNRLAGHLLDVAGVGSVGELWACLAPWDDSPSLELQTPPELDELQSESSNSEYEQPTDESDSEYVDETSPTRRCGGHGRHRPQPQANQLWSDDADHVKRSKDTKLNVSIHPVARRILFTDLSTSHRPFLRSFGENFDRVLKVDSKRAQEHFVTPPPKVTPDSVSYLGGPQTFPLVHMLTTALGRNSSNLHLPYAQASGRLAAELWPTTASE